jgi:ketosteroid isomerase-like protein
VIDYSSKALGRWSAPNWRAGLKSGEVEMNVRAKLVEICDASNAHDLDRIMSFFMDDCVLEMPKGREPYGSRFEDKRNVREGLATSFEGLPDVHYGSAEHF